MAKFGKFGADILENKAFLYFCFIISTISLIFFAKVGDAGSTAVFLIGGYLISLFTKKMAVVLLLALVISYIYKYGVDRMIRAREGMSSSLGNSIDDLMNDQKLQKFFDENTSQNDNILTIFKNIKNTLPNFNKIIDTIQTIKSDTSFVNKAMQFSRDNEAYFQPKMTKIASEFMSDTKNKDAYQYAKAIIEVIDRAVP